MAKGEEGHYGEGQINEIQQRVETLYQAGLKNFENKEYQAAIQNFQKVIDINPDDPGSQLLLISMFLGDHLCIIPLNVRNTEAGTEITREHITGIGSGAAFDEPLSTHSKSQAGPTEAVPGIGGAVF